MKAKLGLIVAVLGLCSAVPAIAHHGFDTEYDQSKKLTLTGTVTKVSWMNPHMRVYIDVTDANGQVTNWNLELTSPNNIRRQGWGPKDLVPGDKVNFEVNPGKLVASRGALRIITKVGDNKPLFVRGGPEAEKEGYKPDAAK
jgi:Family of unknown function (DUF6152)